MCQYERAHWFLQMNVNMKIAYINLPGSRPQFRGHSLTMLLLSHQEHFLLDEKDWAEALLRAEMRVKNQRAKAA